LIAQPLANACLVLRVASISYTRLNFTRSSGCSSSDKQPIFNRACRYTSSLPAECAVVRVTGLQRTKRRITDPNLQFVERRTGGKNHCLWEKILIIIFKGLPVDRGAESALFIAYDTWQQRRIHTNEREFD